jgi:glycosyltransferase involved in cell wall biosynthesis
MVGRLVEKKGVDILIRSVALLKQRGYDMRLTIGGSGPLDGELKLLARTLGLDDEVLFLGALPHSEVADYIKGLDVFTLSCKKDKQGDMDGIPVVLMEAMLAGVPVISTQISGIPELVINNDTGLCVAPSNEVVLAEAIAEIVNKRGLAKLMVKQAIKRVNDQFSLVKYVFSLNELFIRKRKN